MDENMDRKFKSCYSMEMTSDALWMEDEPNNLDNKEACVVLRFESDEMGLADWSCVKQQLPVICQVLLYSVTDLK
jgi:hypothetical protein